MKRPLPPPPPVRVFRPTIPTFREVRGAVFFACLSLVGIVGLARQGRVAGVAVGLGMTLAASSLAYRGRLFGHPTLIADPGGARFVKGGRESAVAWADVEAVTFGPYRRGEIWLVRREGPPVRFHQSMTTADGERFDMVFEEYVDFRDSLAA